MQREPYPCGSILGGAEQSKCKQALLGGARAGGHGHKWRQGKFLLHMRKKPFCCESGQMLAQVAQRGCGVSVLGDAQNWI